MISTATTTGLFGIWCKKTGTWLEDENREPVQHPSTAAARLDIRESLVHKHQYEVKRFDGLPLAAAAPLQTDLFKGVA